MNPNASNRKLKRSERVGAPKDLEDIDRPQPHGHQREEEIDEVDKGNQDDEHRNTQQRVGQRRRTHGEGIRLPGHATVEIEPFKRYERTGTLIVQLLFADLLTPDRSHAFEVFAVDREVKIGPTSGHRIGIGPAVQADEIAVVPVVRSIEVLVADIDKADDVGKGAVCREILIEGYHLFLHLGVLVLLVAEPEDVADAQSEPCGLRTRQGYAVGLSQCLQISLESLQLQRLDKPG